MSAPSATNNSVVMYFNSTAHIHLHGNGPISNPQQWHPPEPSRPSDRTPQRHDAPSADENNSSHYDNDDNNSDNDKRSKAPSRSRASRRSRSRRARQSPSCSRRRSLESRIPKTTQYPVDFYSRIPQTPCIHASKSLSPMTPKSAFPFCQSPSPHHSAPPAPSRHVRTPANSLDD